MRLRKSDMALWRAHKTSDSVTKSIAINKKDPNVSDLFRQMVKIGSRLTASAHGKHAFFLVSRLRERAA